MVKSNIYVCIHEVGLDDFGQRCYRIPRKPGFYRDRDRRKVKQPVLIYYETRYISKGDKYPRLKINKHKTKYKAEQDALKIRLLLSSQPVKSMPKSCTSTTCEGDYGKT